ncbi:type-F conjugative transfer system pilin assembly protein TrbC [uncultured Shewanella sp.]|uniref:type-F conjugative transfer system pilin assembly protein TrbC n=1 Tax=uncultured Shewanella sp. TaxID=173975 RepID=UPI00262B34F7|nr:type-F conjugative transfer system pilin assembly protein TrbC [uncultured Shewanella sp.]
MTLTHRLSTIMTPWISLFLLWSLCSIVSANGYSKAELKALQQKEKETLRPDYLDMSALREKALQFEQITKSINQEKVNTLLNNNPVDPKRAASGVIIFASLSMPTTSLRQLLRQSAAFQVPIVIRGVLPQGFAPTIKKMQSLITHKDKVIESGFAINPLWFKQFNIKQVPSFVAVKPGKCLDHKACNSTDFDVVAGNISLQDALRILSDKGEVPVVASTTLARGS